MLALPNTAGKTYAVLGLGKSGLTTAQALQASGATVLAWDDTAASRDKAAALGITCTAWEQIDWTKITALIMSPGIPHTYPTPHPMAATAKSAGVPLSSDIALLLAVERTARFVGITGTNGKSTTTALIGHILQQAGKSIAVGGNLGTPVLTFPSLGTDGIYVLELSSYQLELMPENRLDIGILLNITPDHLDRHGGMAGYCAAKARIARHDGVQTFICGVDDAPSAALAATAKQLPHITLHTMTAQDNPACALFIRAGQLYVDNAPVLRFSDFPRLPGCHNAQNIAAAYAACQALGLDAATIRDGIASFPGLAHRQQWLGSRGNVQFINDSKATNADAAAKALACYDPIYWIAGGLPKEGGLNGLESFMPRIRHAFLIGQAAEDFGDWLKDKTPVTQCGTLEVAVQAAAKLAHAENRPNATVLLSPACASWDQFKSFEDRGDQFNAMVKQLHAANGAGS